MYSKFLTKNTKLLKESKRKTVKRFKRLSESTPAYEADFEAYDEKYLQSVIDDFCNNCSTPDLARAVFDACGDSAVDALIEAKNIYKSPSGMSGGYAGMIYYSDTVAFFDDNEDDIIELVNDSGLEELYTKFGKDYFENGPDYAKNNMTWFAFEEIIRDFFDTVELDDSGLADKDFLRENSDSEIKNQIKEIIRIIDNSMDDWSNHQEEMSYEGGEEEQDFIDGVRDIKDYLEDMLDTDEEKMKSIAKRIRDTLDDMEEKDAGMCQNFKYNTYYNDAKAAEYKFWKKITRLVDKLDSDD